MLVIKATALIPALLRRPFGASVVALLVPRARALGFLLDPFGVPGVFAPEIRLDSLSWIRQKAAASLQLVGGIDTMHDNSPRTTLSEGSRGITEEISASFCPSNPSQTLPLCYSIP